MGVFQTSLHVFCGPREGISWVHCDDKGIDMVSNNEPVTFKQSSVGAKESKVCQANKVTVILSSVFVGFNLFENKKQQQQENIPHAIIPPAA